MKIFKGLYEVILGMLFLAQAATFEVVGFLAIGAACGALAAAMFRWKFW